jgi:hypothetical protein
VTDAASSASRRRSISRWRSSSSLKKRQLRSHPSTGAHHDATNLIVIRDLVGDEHVEVTFNCKASAEALHEADGAARRALDATMTKCEDPLSREHARQDVVDEVGGGVLGEACGPRGADAASLA